MTDRQKLILIFGVTMSLIALIVIWVLFLNKGTIRINGEPPFSVDIGKIKNRPCDEKECVFKVPPGTYNIKVYKDAYSSEEILVQIKRWQEVQFEPEFEFIPKLQKIGERKFLTLNTESDVSSNLVETTFLLEKSIELNNLPKNINQLSFSFDTSKAFLDSDSKYSLYDTLSDDVSFDIETKYEIKNTCFDKGNNLFYIETAPQNQLLLNKLKLNPDLGKNETELIARFLKSIEIEKTLCSPNGSFILLFEKDNGFYVINSLEKSRHKIAFPVEVQDFEVVGYGLNDQFLIFGFSEKNYLFDLKQETFEEMDINPFIYSANLNDEEVLFVSDSADISIDAVNELNNVQIKYSDKVEQIDLQIYNFKDKSIKNKKVNFDQEIKLDKFEINDTGFYLLSGSDIYQIQLK